MDFEEKDKEWSRKQNCEIPVYQTNKYKEAKKQAIELINEGKYNLKQADFWILMNETKQGKMQYTTLILSHNGCLKINDRLENKFDPESVEIIQNGYKNELVFTYKNKEQGIFEVGEVSTENCSNDYPYAMALKRCFDRVVLKLSRLAYSGIMSDSEAEDEKKEKDDENIENDVISDKKVKALKDAIKKHDMDDSIVKIVLSRFEYSKIEEIKVRDYMEVVNQLKLNA